MSPSRLGSILTILIAASAAVADEQRIEFFENNVRPLVFQHCVKCHGPKKSEAGLRLDSRQGMLKGGDSGPAIRPGSPKTSLLLKAVRHESELQMPPEKKLGNREIRLLETWIKDGAVWPKESPVAVTPGLRGGPITKKEKEFWAYQPIRDPKPPQVDTTPFVRNPIDNFIQARLKKAGLQPSGPASKATLLRRAYFDLTGLPPTPDEVKVFLRDSSSDAFKKVVDRLLSRTAYGERWGRHWLDVVRYADTAGETGDYPTPLSYKYRNWVIRAFNADKPYNQFIQEQIAGDLIGAANEDLSSNEYRDLIAATGFIAISRRFGFDVENYHHLTIQDTIDTLGKSVLGLTLGCARCHDHKFDPVNTNDYYAWYGIFESTQYSFPGSEEKKRPRDMVPGVPVSVAKQKKSAFDRKLAELDAEIKRLGEEQVSIRNRIGSSQFESPFAGFELQPLGGHPESFKPLEVVTVIPEAQSPFTNVFPKGTRGFAMPNNAGNNAFGHPLTAYRPATTPKLYYNIDFQIVGGEGGGAFRFYMGRGPGNSGAVEMSANSNEFFVKNSKQYQVIRKLKVGQWYNLQVVADLRKRLYSGTIGTPGDLVHFEDIHFTDEWDGTIDRTFVDKFGARGGPIAARYFDNLEVRSSPLLPVGKSVLKDSADLADSRWLTYIKERRLRTFAENRDGHVGFTVWHTNSLPVIGVNTTRKELRVPGTVPPGAVVVHPAEKKGAGVAWRSSVQGQVAIKGIAKDAHNCGDSVTWHLDRLSHDGFVMIKEGSVSANGSQRFGSESEPIVVDLEVGDMIQLAIMPKTNHGCDLTQIDLEIAELGGKKRSWKLTRNQAESLQGNPTADAYGDAPWYFYTVEVDRGKSYATNVTRPAKLEEVKKLNQQLQGMAAELSSVTQRRSDLAKAGPYELLYGAIEQKEPKDAQIRIRGDRYRLGDVVPRKNLEILGDEPIKSRKASGRMDLAHWLTRKENTLTARVMVNRIWQQHFGEGLVATENDFGTRGEAPSHPELLDWLATRFMESGWSVKAMHRLIMDSAAYQQSCEMDESAMQRDPKARLLWRFQRRRLSAEEIRDAMLAISGDLDQSMGEAHPFPPSETWGFTQHAPYYGLYPTNRRSIYLMQQRLKRHPFLSLFDGADVNVSTSQREITTVPTQALYLMNSEFVHTRSNRFAERLIAIPDQNARIRTAFELTLARAPDEGELRGVRQFVQQYRESLPPDSKTELEAWAAFARTLFIRNEFLFVD